MFDVIEENDELYFDITHSFRSIPLISLIIANYARTIKNAKINKLFYGNYEQVDLVTNKAPIVDITSMAQLLDWTTSVESFLRTGNPTQIMQLTKENLKVNNKNHELREIKKLTEKLTFLHQNMVTCRGTTFEYNLDEIYEILPEIKQFTNNSLPQMTQLFEKIEEKIEVFNGNKFERMWGIIKWCHEHELYQQAFTFAREFIITIVLEEITDIVDINDIREREDRRGLREDVSSMIYHSINPKFELNVQRLRYPNIYEPVKKLVHEHFDHFKKYSVINDFRNNINHAGYENDVLRINNIQKQSKRMLESIKPLFFNLSK